MVALKRLPEKQKKIFIGFFFLALLLIGLIALPGYGVPSDEPAQFVTLRGIERTYIDTLLGSGTPFDKYFDSLGIFQERVDRTNVSKGMAVFYPFVPLLLTQVISPYLLSLLWHVYVFCLFMIGCWSLYSIVLRLFHSRALACVATLLLYVSPRIFAEAHYNNKDVVALALVLLMIWLGLRLMEKANLPRAFLFGLAGALAANQRLIFFLAFGLICFFVLLRHLICKTFTRKTLAAGFTVVISFAVFFFLFAPHLWRTPGETLHNYFFNSLDQDFWRGSVLFQGVSYHWPAKLPRYYELYFFAISTPIFILLLIGAGHVFLVGRLFKRKEHSPAGVERTLCLILCTLLWIVPMGYSFLLQPTSYNGWRHFTFIYGPMIVLAAYGVFSIFQLLRRKSLRFVAAALLSLCILVSGAGMVINHPHQQAYFNVLAGDAEALYDSDYWFVSTKEALEELLVSPDRNQELPLVVKGDGSYRLNGLSASKRKAIHLLDKEDTETVPSYLLVNPSRERAIRGQEGYAEYLDTLTMDYHVLFDLKSYGHVIMVVWERNEPVAAISSPET